MASLISRRALQKEVHAWLKRPTMCNIISFIKLQKETDNLQAREKNTTFIEDTVYVAAWHDLYGHGWVKIKTKVSNWYIHSHTTMNENSHLIRALFNAWAEDQIVLGTLDDWKEAAIHVSLGARVQDVNLLLDSTDIQIEGRKKFKCKSVWYSGKSAFPALRYMLIMDLVGCIRYISNGYSPKQHDGQWMEEHRDWILTNIPAGAVLAGDCHFTSGKTKFHHIKFHTPYPEPKAVTDNHGNKRQQSLTHDQQQYNKQVHKIRQRVEHPFSQFSNMFHNMKEYWREDWDQLDFLMHFAAAVHNFQLNR